MVSFRHGLDVSASITCAFSYRKVTAAHFQEDCQFGDLWAAVLYTRFASALHCIVPEWGVSLPTYWGVLIQWGAAYLGFTIGAVSTCPVWGVS